MSTFLVAQLIGCIAISISVTIFQVNKRPLMLRLGMMAACFYAVHFFLLGAYTGSAMNLVGAGRSYVFFKVRPDRRHVWVLGVFIAIAAAATFVTWQGSLSLLPLAASTLGGIALWHKKPRAIRHWALLMPPLWFVYNYISGSYPGMIIEVVMLASNLAGQYRFDARHKKTMRHRLAKVA